MKKEIKVPAMGESISEATIGTLIKPNGSQVAADEEVIELETDKVNQVLYAPQAGTLTISVQPGQKVKIGDVIGFVESEGGAKAPTEAPKPAAPAPQPAPVPAPEGGTARKGKEQFVSEVNKTAPEPKKIEVPTQPTGREVRRKMSRLRKVIGERLVEVKQQTAMLTTFNEVDMSKIMDLREKYKEAFTKAHGVKLGFMSFFVKAVVSALQAFPDFNSYIDGADLVHREYYDIGVAVGTDKGLFVPVVRNCDKLSFAEIEASIEQYAKKAKEGTLVVDDLQGGGFTITNGGTYGSMLSTPILNPQQCGILGMHKIQKRPVVVEDQVVVRPIMYLALSYDHRIVDGREAVTFLVHIKDHLEDPARLQLEIP